MSEPAYSGRWYFTFETIKSITDGGLDVAAIQAHLDANPGLVGLLGEKLEQVDALLNSGFGLTSATVTAHGIAGSFEVGYETAVVDGTTGLRFRTASDDDVTLHWMDGTLFFRGDLPLTRTQPVLVRPVKPAPPSLPDVDPEAIQLVVDTFLHRRAHQVLTGFAQAWETRVTSALDESLDDAQRRRFVEGLKELRESVVATIAADTERHMATHLLAALGPERSAELAAACQSDAMRAFRASLAAEQEALNRVHDNAHLELATGLQNRLQNLIETIFEGA